MTKEEKEFTKKLLRKWGSERKIIQLEYNEIKRMEEIIEGMSDIRSMVLSHTPKSKNNSSPVEDNYIRAVELCEERMNIINNRIGDFVEFKNKLDQIIEGLDFEMKYIIKCKYLEDMDWETLSVKYPYPMSLRNFYRIYNESLEIIYNKIKDKDISLDLW